MNDDTILVLDRSYKDKFEQMRVSIGDYNGKKFVSLRKFWRREDDGEWMPSKDGCTVRVKELAKVIDALLECQQRLGG